MRVTQAELAELIQRTGPTDGITVPLLMLLGGPAIDTSHEHGRWAITQLADIRGIRLVPPDGA